jgi:energy-coupling factor transport system ATP-binding protein
MKLRLEAVGYQYMAGTPMQRAAVNDVSLSIAAGDSVALMGPTGSGKSTLAQLFNGLLKPTSGRVFVDDNDIWAAGADMLAVRREVALMFQFPEHQLFEDSVALDVGYGPRNLGAKDVERRSKDALARVGLDWDTYQARSPFALSGGEMRRVALAGVLAMEAGVLVLDEPTAGLDAAGKQHIIATLRDLQAQTGCTLVLITHDTELAVELTKRLIVLHAGRVVADGAAAMLLDAEKLAFAGVEPPAAAVLAAQLRVRGVDVPAGVVRLEQLAQHLLQRVR